MARIQHQCTRRTICFSRCFLSTCSCADLSLSLSLSALPNKDERGWRSGWSCNSRLQVEWCTEQTKNCATKWIKTDLQLLHRHLQPVFSCHRWPKELAPSFQFVSSRGQPSTLLDVRAIPYFYLLNFIPNHGQTPRTRTQLQRWRCNPKGPCSQPGRARSRQGVCPVITSFTSPPPTLFQNHSLKIC